MIRIFYTDYQWNGGIYAEHPLISVMLGVNAEQQIKSAYLPEERSVREKSGAHSANTSPSSSKSVCVSVCEFYVFDQLDL